MLQGLMHMVFAWVEIEPGDDRMADGAHDRLAQLGT